MRNANDHSVPVGRPAVVYDRLLTNQRSEVFFVLAVEARSLTNWFGFVEVIRARRSLCKTSAQCRTRADVEVTPFIASSDHDDR